MKNLAVMAMTFSLGISMTFVSCIIFTMVGNGNLESTERSVSSFEKVHVSGCAEVSFHASQEYRIVVTTDSNLIEKVETNVRSNTLNIGTKSGNFSFTKFLVDVYCPTLTGVSISGSGEFKSNDVITVSKFESEISGSGKIEGTIECEKLYAGISGSGKIIVSGNGRDSNIKIAGSGKFNGTNFIMNDAAINISGSGSANVYVTDNLKARISGSGKINYRGDPKMDSSISGSGVIHKL